MSQVAEGKLSLDRSVWLDANDIRPCCTLSRRHPNGGVSRTVRELLELTLIESDNTAADRLLTLVGGPHAVERRLRALGFGNINVNRSEGQLLLDMAGVVDAPSPDLWTLDLQRRLVSEVPKEALNDARERYLRDERDTATPYEMAQLLGRLQLGDLLPRAETSLLLDLMANSTTGPRRLKGRLPDEVRVAHKTGTTAVVINDVGIITLPPESAIGGHLVLSRVRRQRFQRRPNGAGDLAARRRRLRVLYRQAAPLVMTYFSIATIVAVAYFVTAQLGFRAAFVAQQVTTVWAPTGIAQAALLLWGIRLWPAVWLGAFAANALTEIPLWAAAGIATGNTLEAVAASSILSRFRGFDPGASSERATRRIHPDRSRRQPDHQRVHRRDHAVCRSAGALGAVH